MTPQLTMIMITHLFLVSNYPLPQHGQSLIVEATVLNHERLRVDPRSDVTQLKLNHMSNVPCHLSKFSR